MDIIQDYIKRRRVESILEGLGDNLRKRINKPSDHFRQKKQNKPEVKQHTIKKFAKPPKSIKPTEPTSKVTKAEEQPVHSKQMSGAAGLYKKAKRDSGSSERKLHKVIKAKGNVKKAQGDFNTKVAAADTIRSNVPQKSYRANFRRSNRRYGSVKNYLDKQRAEPGAKRIFRTSAEKKANKKVWEWLLKEGRTTGEDPEATGQRVRSFIDRQTYGDKNKLMAKSGKIASRLINRHGEDKGRKGFTKGYTKPSSKTVPIKTAAARIRKGMTGA